MSSTDFGMFSEEVLFTSNGIRRTRSLFKEVHQAGDNPVFTLSKSPGLIRIKDLYVKFCVEDPSEIVFAETVFGDYSFWKNIESSTWLQPHLSEWREEAEVKRKSLAFKSIINEVKEGGRSSFSASKFLIEEPWKDKRAKPVKEKSEKSSSKAFGQVQGDVELLKADGHLN